ncbi:MAG: response regulator [Candidatus Omnitrophica bacterium]|nr:response regulator [Candidatus Omnitrophota bacterium]
MVKKILVVDDEQEFIDIMRIRLTAEGYDVLEAHDGEEAIKVAEAKKPDVILLDIMMPEKDGYTALREMKHLEKTKSIPVIVVTAKTGLKDLFALEGIKDYIVKPFETDDLLLRIKMVTERKNA